MDQLFDIPYLLTTFGYTGIFVIVFLESGIFFPLPGDSLLFTAGIFAAAQYLNIFILLPLIWLSTFLGGLSGYWVGSNLLKLRKYTFFQKFFKQEHIDKASEFFLKYGNVAITFCRFVPVVRTFVPVVAGIVKVDYKVFMKYSAIGSFLWSFVMTSLGYFLGQIFPQIQKSLWVIVILVVIVSLLPFLVEYVRRRRAN
ncbi:hypothetical protein A3I95_02480 [Candidatus Nomurabacteria bacterium RIFCSPLOWO2_02_FULL_44_12]|uniref:VTT domain-containing protein n=1 Tax=Candidatus Nomurabacteria bacterium RIFCSPLOWO2_12_FULL_44_11 TaxID=1801796 RepID=A0A1F6Y7S3_9BACT|nr:MAG: hypothetical protein A3E95_00670 [Candidatus Nomurabacteria bacterium RIFCSPHIGHO2_12_FULL_44_22b]OGJ02434.1 MAG: hypothetical protein A3G53_03430 [Candidatus Nomurabacteria bacterium RIFCSPLOWO2_12_FULL_44_11]OGJ07031.1 MAG: hypothetical protein A3I95_02480 [Candidatus Nomurabacteria bacterium RIFCSPLOWO2_02_FULL_44_12]